MRFLPRILALFAALAVCKIALSSPTAFDTAGDSAYNSGWTNGSNGGYGWNGGWDLNLSATFMSSLGSDPDVGGIMNSPSAADGRAWKVTTSNAPISAAARHTGSGLQPGQVLSVDFDCPSGDMIFAFADDHWDYIVLSNGPLAPNSPNDYDLEYYDRAYAGPPPYFEDTHVPTFSGPIQIVLTALSATTYDSYFNLQITSLTTGQSETIPDLNFFSWPYPPDVDTFYFGASGSSVVYFNNISITPEPAALATFSIWSLLLLKRRRNKRSSAGI